MLKIPTTELTSPHTILFTAQLALRGQAVNHFALSLRNPACRTAFLADPSGYMRGYQVDDGAQWLVERRDWTGLLEAGGHLQAILKLAATLGESLWHIGAHNAGTSVEVMRSACPRRVSFMPAGAR